MAPVKYWILAIRPRTLMASVAPILMGNALAYAGGFWNASIGLATLVCAMLLQIGVNLANDYFDGKNGIDTDARIGPPRVTQLGLIDQRWVARGMYVSLFGASVVGLWLVSIGGFPLFVAGVLSVLVALAYSGGPWPLASHGMGEIAVFVFFGLVGVAGSFFLQSQQVTWMVLLFACAVGGPVTAILVVNNIRDIDSDRSVGKRTLAVRIGVANSRFEYAVLILSPMMAMITAYKLHQIDIYPLWAMAAMLPVCLVLIAQVYYLEGRALNGLLAKTAIYSFAVALFLSVAVNA